MISRNTWEDKDAYDAQAKKLAALFEENIERYADQLTPEIRAAGPNLG